MTYSPSRELFSLRVRLLEDKLFSTGVFFKKDHIFEFAKFCANDTILMAYGFCDNTPMEIVPGEGDEWKGSQTIPFSEVEFFMLLPHEVILLTTGESK